MIETLILLPVVVVLLVIFSCVKVASKLSRVEEQERKENV